MEEQELSRPVGRIGRHPDVYKVFKRPGPEGPGQRRSPSVEYHCKACGRVSDNHGMLFSRCVEGSDG